MKTIGLIGGMSWESSIRYYQIINELTRQKLGGLHSAKSILYSVDFADIEALQHQHRWQEAAVMLASAARSLEQAGADLVVLCTNTMHKLAHDIEAAIQIPFLHIADATAHKVQSCHLQTVGLLGTRFTMEQDFYRGRLAQKYGLTVMIPDEDDREAIHQIIYQELCRGLINPTSRQRAIESIHRLVDRGAEGIILGCTELELLIHGGDTAVAVFPTTQIHAAAAVDAAIADASVLS